MEQWHDIWLVLFGGAVALIGSVTVTVIEKQWERSEKENERKRIASVSALAMTIKLVEMLRWYSANYSAIDENFKDAGQLAMEPGVKVQPQIGRDVEPSDFTPSELSLVVQTGDTGLLENLLVFQANFLTAAELKREFNRERQAYNIFASENAVKAEAGQGVEVNVELSPEHGPRHDAFIYSLNSMVADLLDATEKGKEEGRNLIKRLQSAFVSLDDFKVHKIEFLKD